MAMVVRSNMNAMNANRNLAMNNNQVAKSLEKLASGYAINRAGDDASGLAISEKMKAQIKGLEQASANSQDGISLVQTAEGAMTEIHSMLNRMVELATKSANGTIQDEVDRDAIQSEVNALREEIDRIADATNFNGIDLLNGSLNDGYDVTTITGTRTWVEADAAGTFSTTMSGVASTGDGTNFDNTGLDIASTFLDGATSGTTGTITHNLTLRVDGEEVEVSFSVDVTKDMTVDDISELYDEAFQEATANYASSDAEYIDGKYEVLSSEITVQNDTSGKTVTEAGTFTADLNSTDYTIADGSQITIGDKTYTINLMTNYAASTVTTESGAAQVSGVIDLDGKEGDLVIQGMASDVALLLNDILEEAGFSTSAASANGNTLTIVDSALAAFEKNSFGSGGYEYSDDYSVEVTGKGKALTLQVGDTYDAFNKVSVSIESMKCDSLGIDSLSVNDQESAGAAIDTIKDAINMVSTNRANLGALQNRLEYTINNLDNTAENMTSANSTIRDTDMASEMMEYTKMNVLVQSAQSMLAQANQAPQQILSLLG